MEEDFLALLRGDAGLTSLVADRINFGEHPQGEAFPAIVLNTISDIEDHHMNGSGGLFSGRVQLDCYGVSYGAAKIVSRAARAVLHHYRGGGFLIITHLSTRDDRQGGDNEADRKHRVSMDFKTQWRLEQ